MAEDQPPKDTLNDCLETVEQLTEENQDLKVENEELRESADAFGELAERLSQTLRKEREAAEADSAPSRDKPSSVK